MNMNLKEINKRKKDTKNYKKKNQETKFIINTLLCRPEGSDIILLIIIIMTMIYDIQKPRTE